MRIHGSKQFLYIKMFFSPYDVLVVYSTSHQRTSTPGPEGRPFGRVDCNCLMQILHTFPWRILVKDRSILIRFSDHFINSQNLFSLLCLNIVRRKLMLVTDLM